jgi:hypothetical protein
VKPSFDFVDVDFAGQVNAPKHLLLAKFGKHDFVCLHPPGATCFPSQNQHVREGRYIDLFRLQSWHFGPQQIPSVIFEKFTSRHTQCLPLGSKPIFKVPCLRGSTMLRQLIGFSVD